jgi:hypothetical protein
MPIRPHDHNNAASALSAAQALTVRRLRLADDVVQRHAVFSARSRALIAKSYQLLDRMPGAILGRFASSADALQAFG